MKNIYRLKKIDPGTFTLEDWNEYYDFRLKCDALKNVPSVFKTMEGLKEFNVRNIEENGEERYQVWKNEVVNGIFLFNIEFKDNQEKRFTYLRNYMIDKYLDIDLLKVVFKKFIDFDQQSNSLAIHSIDGMNDYVEDLFNISMGSVSELYELNIKEANIEKIDTWLAESPAKFPNLRIDFYIEIPDDLLEEYAAFFTQMIEDLPAKAELGDNKITAASIKLDQETEKLGDCGSYRYLIFNELNQLIAMTNVSVNFNHPKEMDQYMTGVRKDYRGRGLSKWLKAAMFKKLVADFPDLEKIKTDTQPENHPSRELSKQMGYKRKGIEKDFLISRSQIVQFLKEK